MCLTSTLFKLTGEAVITVVQLVALVALVAQLFMLVCEAVITLVRRCRACDSWAWPVLKSTLEL